MEQIWPLPALWEAPNWWSGQHAREQGCNSESGENVLIWTSWRSTTRAESCLWDWVTLCKNRVQAVLSRKQPYQKWAGVAQEEAEHELVVLHLAVGQSTHPGCAREGVATRSRWLDLLSLEKEGSTEFLSLCLQLRDWGFKQYRFGFFSGILNGRVNRNELECDTLTKYKEFCIFLNHKAGQTLQLLTHRGCETSSFDVQGTRLWYLSLTRAALRQSPEVPSSLRYSVIWKWTMIVGVNVMLMSERRVWSCVYITVFHRLELLFKLILLLQNLKLNRNL